MVSEKNGSLRCALAVAFRHLDAADTTDQEREHILVAIIDNLQGEEAETAARILHHLREAANKQMLLSDLFRKPGN